MKVDFRGYTGVRIRREFSDARAAWSWAWDRYLWKRFFESIATGVDEVFDA